MPISKAHYEWLKKHEHTQVTSPQQIGLHAGVFVLCVAEHMDWPLDKAQIWMRTKNLNLGGTSPNHLFAIGRAHKVIQFVLAAIDECTPPNVHPWERVGPEIEELSPADK